MPATSRRIGAAAVFPEPGFPLAVLRQPRHGPVRRHRHDFHELVVILAGRGRHITDRGSCAIEAGDAFLIGPHGSHAYADTHDLALVNILFDPQRLRLPLAGLGDLPGYHALFRVEPRLRPRGGGPGRLRLASSELAAAAQQVARLQTELSGRRPGYRFAACACLMELILYLSRCYGRAPAPAARPALRIGAVLSHIEKHFAEPIRVGQLAQMAHLSESSLLRAFRQVMGTSPLDHVIRVRVGQAAELLRQGDVRVTEAAFRCGFGDSNYFARQFRRVLGCSPREYRRAPP
jgi:AraC-like DNA-binding protein